MNDHAVGEQGEGKQGEPHEPAFYGTSVRSTRRGPFSRRARDLGRRERSTREDHVADDGRLGRHCGPGEMGALARYGRTLASDPIARRMNVVHVLLGPFAKRLQGTKESPTERCEARDS